MNEDVKKHRLNVPGKYYVDCNVCLDHAMCVYDAPNNFRMDNEEYGAYIFKQPATPEEEAQCHQAMQDCPVAAIHDDGEIVETD